MSNLHRIDREPEFELIGGFSHQIEEAALKGMLDEYVDMYNADSGDSIKEYATRASFDVYPAKFGNTRDRLAFRTELKERLRA